MSLTTGNMYSIPEHPSEEETAEERYSELSLSVTETCTSNVTKKVSSSSLPEKPTKILVEDTDHDNKFVTTESTSEATVQHHEAVTGSRTFQHDINRLSVSLFDISNFDLTSDSGTFKADNQNAFTNMASSHMISGKNSNPYLEVQDDCIWHSNQGNASERALSSSAIYDGNSNNESNPGKNTHGCRSNERKYSDNLVIIDLNESSGKCLSVEDFSGPSVLRERSRSVQWIQNTFQSVSNRYKYLLESRRPSDIVEERMRKSKEELEMEEPEYEVLAEKSSVGPRRFSENVIGKQKKFFPFTSHFGHLKDFWKDKNPPSNKRHEEKDIDQNRTDVCPLFTFPRNCDEDELILDALRQAMRKCTAVDPTTRPNSSTVLDQLSKLLD